MNKFFLTLLIMTLTTSLTTACNSKKHIVVSDKQYTLISAGKTNSNGIVDVPLYKKEGDDSRYYTPSLDGKSMIPFMK